MATRDGAAGAAAGNGGLAIDGPNGSGGADGASSTLHIGPCEDGKGSGTSIVYTNTWGPIVEGKSKSSVGFEFSCDGGPCVCGTFADAHTFWVAPPAGATGVVHIDGFSPDRCVECVEATGSGSSLRNGWLANPTGDLRQYRGLPVRLATAARPSPVVPTPATPYAVDTKAAGFVARMIVKSDSDLDTGTTDCYATGASTLRMCFEYFNTIAVLATPPANGGATVLRPAVFGGNDSQKELLPASQIDLSLLPVMDIVLRPSTGKPVGQGWEGSLEALMEPRMEWFYDWEGNEVGTAARNSSTSTIPLTNGYGPSKHKPINEALLWLTFNPSQQGGDPNKKRLLAIRAAQLGMDACGAILYGGANADSPGEYGGWPASGGHGVGRYARAVVAATLLHHTACLAAIGKGADNHKQSFCVGGVNAGERCGEHWGRATCGEGGSCVVSTQAKDICDEHLGTFAETSQMQHANTHGALGAGMALYGTWRSGVIWWATPDGSNPIYADDEAWIDGGSGSSNGCPGQYQDISWPALMVQLPVLKAIPATWPYVNPTYFEYTDRMFRTGVHCAPDNRVVKDCGDQNANTAQVTQRCAGGADVGRPCLADNDCQGGSCSAGGPLHTRPGTNYDNSDYESLQSLYQYEVNKDCYTDCSCAGMGGLCHGQP